MPTPETRVEEILSNLDKVQFFLVPEEQREYKIKLLTTLATTERARGREEAEKRFSPFLQHEITCRTQYDSLECDCGLHGLLTSDDKIN